MIPFTLPSTLPGEVNTLSDTGGAAGTLAEVTDHCAAGLGLLISQYQNSPRLQALLCGYLDQVQAVERGLVGMYERSIDITRASGEQLDLLGRIVREARDGRSDDDYRRGIRVRLLINRSQGRHEELIAIVRLFEDMTTGVVRLRDYQPARIVVWVQAPAVNPSPEVFRRVRAARAAGVAVQTVTQPAAPTGRLFALGRTADKANITTGLGWTGDTRGGHLGHALS
jgi:hypothetical protein